MHNMNRLGFASILQVMILAALSILSMSLIWGYVSDLSGDLDNQLSPVVDCIAQKSLVKSACVNADGEIEVELNVGLGEKINKLDLNFKGQSFECSQACSSCNVIDREWKKTIYLSPRSQPIAQDMLGVSINGCIPNVLGLSTCS
jgi:hypothetical protein